MAAVNAENGLNKLSSTNLIARSDADNIIQVGGDVLSAVISLVEQYFFGSGSNSSSTPTTSATATAATATVSPGAAATAASTKASTKAATTKSAAATTGATTSFTAATAAATGNNVLSSLASKYKREEAPPFLDERDAADLVQSAVDAISNSGLLSEFVNKTLADPSAGSSFLSTALQEGTIGVEDLYNWAKSSGAFDKFISWLKTNAPTYFGSFSGVINALVDSGDAAAGSQAAASSQAPAPTTLLTKRMLY